MIRPYVIFWKAASAVIVRLVARAVEDCRQRDECVTAYMRWEGGGQGLTLK